MTGQQVDNRGFKTITVQKVKGETTDYNNLVQLSNIRQACLENMNRNCKVILYKLFLKTVLLF